MTPKTGDFGDDAAAPGNDDPRIADLERQVTELTAKVGQLTELAARAQADLQNAKTRMKKDADDLQKYAAEAVLKKFLPVIDGFQRAFSHLPADLKANAWVTGVAAVEQELLRQAREMGLQKMEVMGAQVDTAKHEVLTIGPGKEGEIIQILEDGYELNGKILRPAKVMVGDGSR
jgi:molecular chaperone GrpE